MRYGHFTAVTQAQQVEASRKAEEAANSAASLSDQAVDAAIESAMVCTQHKSAAPFHCIASNPKVGPHNVGRRTHAFNR